MLIRFSYLFMIGAVAIAAMLLIHFTTGRTGDYPKYTGVERCRSCHAAVSSGAQYDRWLRGPHSKAYSVLQSDSAQAYVRAHNASEASCLPCHTTLGRPAAGASEHVLNKQGVGCERCHGPGSEYAFYDVMTDPAAFIEHGGVAGSLDDCYSCHARTPSEASTPVCPFQKNDFAADSAWQMIRHPVAEGLPEVDTVIDLRLNDN